MDDSCMYQMNYMRMYVFSLNKGDFITEYRDVIFEIIEIP